MSRESLPSAARRGLALAALLLVLLVPRVARAGYSQGGGNETVEEKDDFFDPEAIHVPVGATIDWKNAGRNPHTVTADDGSFESGNQDPGSEYSFKGRSPITAGTTGPSAGSGWPASSWSATPYSPLFPAAL